MSETKAREYRRVVTSAAAGFSAVLGLCMALCGAPSAFGATETSPPSGYLRVEQDNAAVAYTGNWTTEPSTSNCSYSGGNAVEATAAGAQATFSFTGTAVRWVGYQDASSGIADVYIDGVFQTSVDTYSLSPVCQSLIFSLSGLTSGPHTLTITATGTHSLLSLGTGVWVDAFDFQPQPTVSLTAPAGGATVSGTTTVSATASESGGSIASVQFKLDGANLGAADTTAPYSVSWNTTGAANGSHSLTAVATDSVGNTATSSAVTVTVLNDTSPPTVSITAPASGATVSGNVTVSASASDADGSITGVQFKLDGANLGTKLTASPYSLSWNTATATNGSHTLTAVATDSGGNSTTSSAVTVTVSNDTSPPAVSITAPASGATVSGNVTVSASASDADGSITGVQFKLDGADLGAVDTTAPYSVSWNTTVATNGSHSLTAVATDSGGNSTTSSAVTVTVSNTTVGPPTVSLTAPANDATVSGTTTISATASESGGSIASVQFELDGADLGAADTTSPYSASWNTTTATNGSHTLTAVATDSTGHSATSSAVTVTVSNSTGGTPTVSLTAPASGATVSGTTTVSASASESGGSIASVQFKLDGADLGTADTAAPYSLSWNTTVAMNGSHSLTAVATDSTGHSATSTAVTVTVSNTNTGGTPTVILTTPANGATVSGTITVSATASESGGTISSVQFKLDGVDLGAADTATPYSVSWNTTTATNGSHSLTAVATDSTGHSATATAVTVTVSNGVVDTAPPTVALTSPADGATISGSVAVFANASDDTSVASVQFTLDGANLGAAVTSSPYHVTWVTATASNGNHTLSAVATDSAGNTAAASPVTVIVSNGATTTTTRVQETGAGITYSGNWVQASDGSFSGGTANESNAANATATLKFTGVAVTWISYRCSCTAGLAEVSVDGGAPTQVDSYAATPQSQAPVYTASGLTRGPHTLKITVTGNADPAGNSAYVVVDAFDITDAPPTTEGTNPPPGKSGGGTLGVLDISGLLYLVLRRKRRRGPVSHFSTLM